MISIHRSALILSALWLVAACGGDSGGGSAVAPAPAPSPTPTPSPTPSSTPTPTAQVAAFTQGLNPDGDSAKLFDLYATNAGLYTLASYPNDDKKPSRVFKVQGSPAQASSWITATPDTDPAALVTDIAPRNIYSEPDRAISFYWTSITAARDKFNKWGFYTANAGGVSVTASDDTLGNPWGTTIELVAAGAVNGIVASRPWIISERRGGSDGYSVFQDDGGYTAANTISDRFSIEAKPQPGGFPTVTASHPTDPHLYVGAGSVLYVYDANRVLRSYQFPTSDPAAAFSDLLWADGDLYISYGANIYRMRDNEITQFMPVAFYSGGFAPGRFCITGGSIFTVDGMARSLTSGTTRNWVSRGSLNAAQTEAQATILGGIGSGIFCSPQNGNVIWMRSLGLSGVLQVTPLL